MSDRSTDPAKDDELEVIQPRVITPPKTAAPPSERGPDSPPLGRTLRNMRNARREIT